MKLTDLSCSCPYCCYPDEKRPENLIEFETGIVMKNSNKMIETKSVWIYCFGDILVLSGTAFNDCIEQHINYCPMCGRKLPCYE